MGIFFNTPKPRVTPLEWKMVRGNLYSQHHFSSRELQVVEGILQGDMNETRELDRGIDTDELMKAIQYMRAHINVHHIPLNKIDALEVEMMKKIALH
jgi:hypothetical protein